MVNYRLVLFGFPLANPRCSAASGAGNFPARSPNGSPVGLVQEPEDGSGKMAMVKVRGRQQVFRFQVLAQYGAKCGVCSIKHPNLLKAAHIRGKREKGSDDWRNDSLIDGRYNARYLFSPPIGDVLNA
jgi:hypothetical protein